MIVDTIDSSCDYMVNHATMAAKKKKTTSTTLQIVMKARQEELLQQLADKLGVPKSTILVECARRVVERYEYLLDENVSDNTRN